MKNSINWFEIPVVDLPRATGFYEKVLGAKLELAEDQGERMAIFKAEGVAGCLVQTKRRRPSADGALLYLDTAGQLDAMVSRVQGAGGKVLMPRTEVAPHGSIAVLLDTEGNQVGLHQHPR